MSTNSCNNFESRISVVHFESRILVIGYEFLVGNRFSILDLMVQILVLVGFSKFSVSASWF
jgi:hypothetical protein